MNKFNKVSAIIFVGALSLFGAQFAFATPHGTPFDAIWDAVHGLQDQLDHLVLTPGPIGPQGPQGEVGPMGPQGETGATGPQGDSWSAGNFYYNTAFIDLPPFIGAASSARANCNPGDIALSGGFYSEPDVKIIKSFPPVTAHAPGTPSVPNPSIWQVDAINEVPVAGSVTVYVRCVDLL